MSDRPTITLPGPCGPVAHLQPVWIFEVNKRDALLILRALGGRLTNDDEQEAARLLGNRLTLQRAKLAGELAAGLEINAEAARADMEKTP